MDLPGLKCSRVELSGVESREEEMTGLEIVEWSGVDSSRVEKSGVWREVEMSGVEWSREISALESPRKKWNRVE